MGEPYYAGSADQSVDVFIPDSSSLTGGGLTGLVFDSAGLTCYYRKGATGAATALALVTQTVAGAHTDGGFKEIDATNMPGVYRLDLSDAIVDTAGRATVFLKGATNMAPVAVRIDVLAYNPFDGVRLGLTGIANAAAGGAGGLALVGSAMALTSSERDAVADAHLDRADAIETGLTPRKAHRVAAAVTGGDLSGAGTGTEVITGAGVATTRVTSAADSSGNRTVTLSL